MMNTTVIFMIVIGLTIAAFDVYIIFAKGKPESISAHIIRGSRKYPMLVLLFGILLGHLFWSMRTDDVYDDIECVKVEKEKEL